MAATLTPYPPHQPQSAKRISPSAALANISAYLAESESTPHLHPDAQLHPEGIKFSTTGGPSGGLVLHHVRRVEKGLSGEVLAPEKDELEAMFGDDTHLDSLAAETERGLNGEPKRKGGLKKKSAYDTTETIDAEEWARSQEVLVGEVGERDNAGGEVVYGDDNDGDAMEIDAGEGAGMSQREKERRKEEKKARQKLEKRRKEEQRAKKG